jgi:hypothetical protein
MATTNPTPAQQVQSSIDSLKYTIDNLRSRVTLSGLRDEVSTLHNTILGLPQRVKDLRTRNYAFEKQLEPRALEMNVRWATIRGSVDGQILQQSAMLQNDMRSLDAKLPALVSLAANLPAAQSMLPPMQAEAEGLERRTSAAENAIKNMFKAFQDEYNNLDHHLDQVTWAIEQQEQATFQLLPTEAVVMAVSALWTVNGKEDNTDPKGVLFLTDQRILFEQKQDVATKKFLFITTASEKVQKLLWEFPVALFNEGIATKQGLFKNQDFIELQLASGAPYPLVSLHLDGQDSEGWVVLIKRVKVHDLDADRVIAIDLQEVEKVKKAPTICSSCGGVISKPILRGQDQITCEFCGAVIRL